MSQGGQGKVPRARGAGAAGLVQLRLFWPALSLPEVVVALPADSGMGLDSELLPCCGRKAPLSDRGEAQGLAGY